MHSSVLTAYITDIDKEAVEMTFVQIQVTVFGFAAEKLLRPQNVKQTSANKGLRESWEPSIHLDGRPVDRFAISSSKPTRSHRFTKAGKDNHSHLLEDVGKAESQRKGLGGHDEGPRAKVCKNFIYFYKVSVAGF